MGIIKYLSAYLVRETVLIEIQRFIEQNSALKHAWYSRGG